MRLTDIGPLKYIGYGTFAGSKTASTYTSILVAYLNYIEYQSTTGGGGTSGYRNYALPIRCLAY